MTWFDATIVWFLFPMLLCAVVMLVLMATRGMGGGCMWRGDRPEHDDHEEQVR